MIHYGLKTIFIHIPRTAGNSISFALRQYNNYDASNKIKHKGIFYYYKYHKNIVDEYFKFSCVRNPFEKLYSNYMFKLIRQDEDCINTEFNDWILKYYNNDKSGIVFKSQLAFLTINNEIKVDFIIRYENLKTDYNKVCEKLNIENNLLYLFPTCKVDYRKKYNDKSIEIISNIFKRDLELFGYTFDGVKNVNNSTT